VKELDVLDTKTGDEEEEHEGSEENEQAEDEVLVAVTAGSLDELRQEREVVKRLLALARRVEARGDESKFDKLREVLTQQARGGKVLIFTEHRDTLEFLVRRLQGLGYTGQVAQLHGGMDYREREEQVGFFRRPTTEGGAQLLVATDAAGEGINLQF